MKITAVTLSLFLAGALFPFTAEEPTPTASTAPKNKVSFSKASELLGMAVENSSNEKLGDLRELVFDFPNSRLVYTVLASGGFLGIGDKLIAIPPMALHLDKDGKALVLDADKEALRAAPSLANTTSAPVASAEWAIASYDHFKIEMQPGMEIRETAGAERKAEADRGARDEQGEAGAPEVSDDGPTSAAFTRCSELIGTTVKNQRNEKLGDIRDVSLDLKTGKIVYAVLSAGGFLGIGDKLFAVPPNAFSRSPDDRSLVVNATKESLKAAASFDQNTWPATADQSFVITRVSEHIVPDEPRGGTVFHEAAGARREPEEKQALTASDQSNTRRDVSLTQRVRRALMADDALSFTAKNVQVITVDGKTTIRGAVSAAEKENILLKARDVAGARNVEDQLEVDPE